MNSLTWTGIKILIAVEAFFFTFSVMVHECCHAICFYILCGRFGEIHLYDSVAYSYHQIAVTIPPQGVVISGTTFLECIAYAMTFLITGVFAFIVFKLFYSDSNAKKSEMSSI